MNSRLKRRITWLFLLMATLAHTPVPAEEGISDAEQLLRLHQAVLQAHLDGDLKSWMADEAEDYVMANRGEISFPSKAERASRIGPYLAQTTFSEYRDLTTPVVRVSEDGSLGWVIAQVRIVGTQAGADEKSTSLESTWAWIELYEKKGGRWLRMGNLSNMKPAESPEN